MITIVIHATPTQKFTPQSKEHSGMNANIQFHVATMYRGKERFKVFATSSIEGVIYTMTSKDKPTGWEDFCRKWAERIKLAHIAWGHHYVNGLVTEQVEEYFNQWKCRLVIDKSNNPLSKVYKNYDSVRVQARQSLRAKQLLPRGKYYFSE